MSVWSRRELLQAGIAGMLGASLPALADSAQPEDSLAVLARMKGLWFGSALSGRGLRDEQYLKLIADQCAILVPENELKMTVIQRNPGEFNLGPAENLLRAGAYAFRDRRVRIRANQQHAHRQTVMLRRFVPDEEERRHGNGCFRF